MLASPLIDEAKKAEEVGEVFSLFTNALPERATPITALISSFFAISSNLRDIDAGIHLPQYRGQYRLIADDLTPVRRSLLISLDKIQEILGNIGDGQTVLTIEAYRRGWNNIHRHFMGPRLTLLMRLNLYRRYLEVLTGWLRRHPPSAEALRKLRRELHALDQTPDVADQLGDLHLGTSPPHADLRQSRSYERPRPSTGSTSANSPTDSIPPLSTSSNTSDRGSNGGMNAITHWAQRVFQGASTTALPRYEARTECFDRGSSESPAQLDQQYNFLFDLKFKIQGEHESIVGLYVRPQDNRARILFETHQGRRSTYSCRPLYALEFRRNGNVLHLCTKESGRLSKWATVKFKTIERLVLVHCTLVALRGYDMSRQIFNINDFELHGEDEHYGGTIEDDGYLHALRIYHDPASNAVRLMASVLRGDLKNTPVWTAFIHYNIQSTNWLVRSSERPKRILLCNLSRHVMAPEYRPMTDSLGRHILDFAKTSDANDFERSIGDMARLISRPGRR